MQTYHNDQNVKDKYLNRVAQHRIADELIRGMGWKNGRGCAVGCTLEAYTHSLYPIELGIPEWLAHLEDHIFETLPEIEAQQWPEQFLQAIPVGIFEIKFNKIRNQFQIFWLERQKTQIDCNKFPQVETSINQVIALLQQALQGNEAESAAWSAARSAAWSAAESAAWSAAESAARSAAESAAWSVAWLATRSAARSVVEQEARVKRDWLLAAFKSI